MRLYNRLAVNLISPLGRDRISDSNRIDSRVFWIIIISTKISFIINVMCVMFAFKGGKKTEKEGSGLGIEKKRDGQKE